MSKVGEKTKQSLAAFSENNPSNRLNLSTYKNPGDLNFYTKRYFKTPYKDNKVTDICWGSGRLCRIVGQVDDNGHIELYDALENKLMYRGEIAKTWLNCIDIEKSEGKKILCGTMDAKVIVCENSMTTKKGNSLDTIKAVHQLNGHNGSVTSCKFLNSNYLISGGSDSTVCLWDLESPERYLSAYHEHSADVTSFDVFHYDANIFLSGSTDLTTRIWDIRVKQPTQLTFKNHENSVNTVSFMPFENPTTFCSGSDDSTIKMQDIRMKGEISTFFDPGNFESVYSIAISRTGRFIFAGTESNKLKVWDTLGAGNAMKNVFRNDLLPDLKGMVNSVKLSCDGYSLAMCGRASEGVWLLM